MKKALIFYGGWDGHDPKNVAERFNKILLKNNFDVEMYEGVNCISEKGNLCDFDLLVPIMTCSSLGDRNAAIVMEAVKQGTGIAGFHGGMCDAFRSNAEWQYITGGQFVSHPGGCEVNYRVNIVKGSSELVEGIDDFDVCSEQYYMQYDPSVDVLATTDFRFENKFYPNDKIIKMPVIWTRYFEAGRIYYNSLGHNNEFFDKYPVSEKLIERGMLWAAQGKEYAAKFNK